MQISQEQYARLRDLSQQIDAILNEVRGIKSREEEGINNWNNRMGILAEVMLKGGIVTKNDWKDIGKEYGRDPRGLGGYFTGNHPSMLSIGNDKRAITDMGIKEVQTWLSGRISTQPWEKQLKKYKQLIEKNK